MKRICSDLLKGSDSPRSVDHPHSSMILSDDSSGVCWVFTAITVSGTRWEKGDRTTISMLGCKRVPTINLLLQPAIKRNCSFVQLNINIALAFLPGRCIFFLINDLIFCLSFPFSECKYYHILQQLSYSTTIIIFYKHAREVTRCVPTLYFRADLS